MNRSANQYSKYIESLYASEDETLKKICANLDPGKLAMQISPTEARIIQMLLKLVKAKKVLEIGSLVGYSAIWIARALSESGHLTCIEKNEQNYREAKSNIASAGLTDKINLIHGIALTILPQLEIEAPFDAVFIDADKINYPRYLGFAYNYLSSGGLIIADNTFLFGTVFESVPPLKNPQMWHAMKEFNEKLADRSKFDSVIIPTIAGLTIALKI